MLLSPDGTMVAVGDHDTDRPDLLLVDLTTGAVDTRPLPGGRGALPLAWSSDGNRIAYVTTPGPNDPYSGVTTGGDLGILDVTTGRATPCPEPPACSPSPSPPTAPGSPSNART